MFHTADDVSRSFQQLEELRRHPAERRRGVFDESPLIRAAREETSVVVLGASVPGETQCSFLGKPSARSWGNTVVTVQTD